MICLRVQRPYPSYEIMFHMRLLSRLFALLLVLGGAFGLGGCATTDSHTGSDQVSAIPWNRPASWEGRGPLGGMMMSQGR